MVEKCKNETYWVGSTGEDPERLYFTCADAMNSAHRYLDSFDNNGEHVCSYMMADDDRYTTDF
jgi:hypothetical protein